MPRFSLSITVSAMLILALSCTETTTPNQSDPDPTGTLEINTLPSALTPPWRLTGPDGSAVDGSGSRTFTNADIGSYTLTWLGVASWATPDPAEVTLTLASGQTGIFSGEYVRQSGTLSIDARPGAIAAPWELVGPNGFSQSGNGDASLADLDVGDYTVTWLGVTNHDAPDPSEETQTLIDGGTLNFAGEYERHTGTVTIDAQPNEAAGSWALAGPDGYSETGAGDVTLPDVATGEYTLTWISVNGYDDPAPPQLTQTLAANGSVTFIGVYQAQTGTIIVRPEPHPLDAPWTLAGPEGFNESGTGSVTFSGVRVGDYIVYWQPMVGQTSPEPQQETVTLSSGVTETLSGAYGEYADPYEANDELGDEAFLAGGPLTDPDDGVVIIAVEGAVLDADDADFYGLESSDGVPIAVRVQPVALYGHPNDARNLGVRLWRSTSPDNDTFQLVAQIDFNDAGGSEYHPPIPYDPSGYMVVEIYSVDGVDAWQPYLLRISNSAITP